VPSSRIRIAALTLAAGIAVPAVLALTAAPASAHNELLSSSPASGARVTALPSDIVLTFAEQTDPRFVKIAATGPDGASVAAGAPQVAGTKVSQPLAAGTASGQYTIAYRVVSKDGHPVQGSLTFTATLPAAEPSAAGTPPATTNPAGVAGAPPADQVAKTASTGGLSGFGYALTGLGVLAVLGAVLMLVRRRQPRNG